MEQRGTPEVLQAVFVVLPELERKKLEGPSPLPQQLLPTLMSSVKGRWKRQQYQGSFAIHFAKVRSPEALLNSLRGFVRVPNCGRHIFTLFEWCVLPACSHLASWPWRDAQQQSYSLQRDALLEIFWSRDIIWNCASILKQRLNCQGAVKLSGVQKIEKKSNIHTLFLLWIYKPMHLMSTSSTWVLCHFCSMNGLLG